MSAQVQIQELTISHYSKSSLEVAGRQRCPGTLHRAVCLKYPGMIAMIEAHEIGSSKGTYISAHLQGTTPVARHKAGCGGLTLRQVALGMPTSARVAKACLFRDDSDTWSKSISRSFLTPDLSSKCAAWLPTPCKSKPETALAEGHTAHNRLRCMAMFTLLNLCQAQQLQKCVSKTYNSGRSG